MSLLAFSTLRARLLLLVLLATLPAIGLTLYTGQQQRNQAAARAKENALRLARLAAANHAQLLDETGQVQAVLAVSLDFAWLNQIATQAQLPPGSSLSVINSQGTLLAHYPESEQWVGKTLPDVTIVQELLARGGEGTAEARGMDGVVRLYGFTSVPGAAHSGEALRLFVGIPVAVAFAETNRLQTLNLTGLGLVLILRFVVAWVGSDRLVLRQIYALVSATRRLAAGDLNTRIGIASGALELH